MLCVGLTLHIIAIYTHYIRYRNSEGNRLYSNVMALSFTYSILLEIGFICNK